MSDITVEKKLELMRQIRAQNEQNRFDMSRREQILYGKMTENPYMDSEKLWDNSLNMEVHAQEEEFQTFPLRILLSLALFLLIIISDISGKSFMGMKATDCFAVLAEDYESSITAWVDAASESNTITNFNDLQVP